MIDEHTVPRAPTRSATNPHGAQRCALCVLRNRRRRRATSHVLQRAHQTARGPSWQEGFCTTPGAARLTHDCSVGRGLVGPRAHAGRHLRERRHVIGLRASKSSVRRNQAEIERIAAKTREPLAPVRRRRRRDAREKNNLAHQPHTDSGSVLLSATKSAGVPHDSGGPRARPAA